MSVVGAVALGSAAVVIAGAGRALASGQYCTSNNDFQICQQVNGAGTVINWAKGIVTPKNDFGYPFEITMTGIGGGTLCQENFPNTNGDKAQSCYWNGGGREYLKGNICTAVQYYGGILEGWIQDGSSCLYVS